MIIRSLRSFRRKLRKRDVLIRIVVNAAALKANLKTLQSLAPQWQIAPVLKSNAYGHGLELVAHVFEREPHIPFLCVDSYFEAEALRAAGITKDILILGYTPLSVIGAGHRGVSFSVASLDDLAALATRRTRAPLQLKFDTGMHRQGIPHDDAGTAIALLQKNPHLKVSGVFSHLANPGKAGSPLTRIQIERWNALVRKFQKAFPDIHFYHLASSVGFRLASSIEATIGRAGLALYGIGSKNFSVPLTPALRMETRVTSLRTVPKGETVGYNGAFVASRALTAATVPVGYFEGIDRRLSDAGSFTVHGAAASIIGFVSMNVTSCDVTDIPDVVTGTPAVLISDDISAPNSIERIATTCGTIPYEILVHIPAHLQRTLVNE